MVCILHIFIEYIILWLDYNNYLLKIIIRGERVSNSNDALDM